MSTIPWTRDPLELWRVGPAFRLSDVDPSATPGFGDRTTTRDERGSDKRAAEALLRENAKELAHLQEKLFAESRAGGARSVLLVLQGMDTSGKGGIIRHVAGAFDPQGVVVHSFKAPTPTELEHDFLWRIRERLPNAGRIGVFDRSHYEDVLIRRVRGLSSPDVIEERYGLITEFERSLVTGGMTVIKVMLHISAAVQKSRLAERLDRPDKHWKYSPGDVDERMLWPDYQQAYHVALTRTSVPEAPWFVVPADKKWYARIAVQHLLLDALRRLDPQWPVADFDVDVEKRRLAASDLS